MAEIQAGAPVEFAGLQFDCAMSLTTRGLGNLVRHS